MIEGVGELWRAGMGAESGAKWQRNERMLIVKWMTIAKWMILLCVPICSGFEQITRSFVDCFLF